MTSPSTGWKTRALIVAAPLLLTLVAYSQELESTLTEVLDQTLQIDVDLVMVPVTVTNERNRPVTGLRQEHFQVFEDRIEQEIVSFGAEDIPISIGIIFDVSGSMGDQIGLARQASASFLQHGTPDDEVFLVLFNAEAEIVQDFTNDINSIQRFLLFKETGGMTAMYDAVYLGLEKVQEGINPKKALLLVTDGLDNRSRYRLSNVREFIRESEVQLYSIGGARTLAEETGGRAFFPRRMSELADISRSISIELKNQYVIGYESTNETTDGEWRDIDVRLDPPTGAPRLISRARRGYYAPVQ
jgi:Ca-activated chloride channel family protein